MDRMQKESGWGSFKGPSVNNKTVGREISLDDGTKGIEMPIVVGDKSVHVVLPLSALGKNRNEQMKSCFKIRRKNGDSKREY